MDKEADQKEDDKQKTPSNESKEGEQKEDEKKKKPRKPTGPRVSRFLFLFCFFLTIGLPLCAEIRGETSLW